MGTELSYCGQVRKNAEGLGGSHHIGWLAIVLRRPGLEAFWRLFGLH